MSEQETIDALKAEGYEDVSLAVFEGPEDMGEHMHDVDTVHVVMQGDLIVSDAGGETSFAAGDRMEFPAGTKHSVRTGPNGLKMVVGFMKNA